MTHAVRFYMNQFFTNSSDCGEDSNMFNTLSKKRKLEENHSMDTESKENRMLPTIKPQRRKFLAISCQNCIFQSESIDTQGSRMYSPVQEDMLINPKVYDQITFGEG